MKKFIKNHYHLIILLFFIFIFGLNYASATELYNPIPNIDMSKPPAEIAVSIIGLIIGGIIQIVAGLALIFIVIGGIMYMISGASENMLTLSKSMVYNAIIGLALAAGAAVLISEVAVALGADDPLLGNTFAMSDNLRDIFNRGEDSVNSIIKNIIDLLLSLLAMFGIIGIVIGSIWYMTSAGNDEKMETGKKTVIYSIIGLAIAMGSLVIVQQIANLIENT